MTGVEEDKLLKLHGMSYAALNTTYLVQQNDTLSSSLLWHAHFSHFNYENIRIMKQRGLRDFQQFPENSPHVMLVYWASITNILFKILSLEIQGN